MTAQPPDSGLQASPTEAPAQRTAVPGAPTEIEHTPTPPLGTVSNYAEAATSIPPNTPVTVAPDPTLTPDPQDPGTQALAGAIVSAAPGQIEIAAPAPLPRPGDEKLTRGTAAHAALQEELTGEAPVMPADPDSEEVQQALMEQRKADLQQAKDAADAAAANQQKLLDAQPQTGQTPAA